MRQQPKRSIDGFVSRQTLPPVVVPSKPAPTLSPRSTPLPARQPSPAPVQQPPVVTKQPASVTSSQPTAARTSMSDLEASLREIDATKPAATTVRPQKMRRRFWLFGKKRLVKTMSSRKKIILWIVAVVVAAALIVGGYLLYQALTATSKLVHGNLLSLVEPDTPLKTDSEGRTNILVFGTSQDDAAHQQAIGGGGLWLTDSIMLISINQKTHAVNMVSIPRDLWVSMPTACSVGYQAKINAVYECAADLLSDDGSADKKSNYNDVDKKGATALETTIKTVTGLTPQYYVHVNYSVLKESVDALGGIEVNIEGDGADGIYDTNFDWNCSNGPYTCKHVYYPHNGTYTLDGQAALYLARARSDAGKYSYKNFGLNRGDYDRQANQQKILQAIQAKASSTGTLANPVKVTNLLTALGNNITTNLEGGELKTLIKFAKNIDAGGMNSISLVKEGESVVTSQMISGQSAQVATSGVLDYTSIINYLAKKMSTNPAVAEGAKVAIYNASGTVGAASTLSTTLTTDGVTVSSTGNASAKDADGEYVIYDLSGSKMPQTISYLQKKLSGATVRTSKLPSDISAGDADIVIIIGKSTTASN